MCQEVLHYYSIYQSLCFWIKLLVRQMWFNYWSGHTARLFMLN